VSGQFQTPAVRGNSSRIEFCSRLGVTSAGSTVLEKVKIACSCWYSKYDSLIVYPIAYSLQWLSDHHHHHHHRLYSPGWALASNWVFLTILFLRGGVVSLTPNPQPGGPGYPFLSETSPLTCLAWEALPVAYATASIALGFIWPHKPRHYAKVGIPSGGTEWSAWNISEHPSKDWICGFCDRRRHNKTRKFGSGQRTQFW
jgi:hypothetical protein